MVVGDANLITGLIELARQVRRGTLQMLDAASKTCLTWTPPGTSNHILWHAGHALWVSDVLIIEPLIGKCKSPPGWVAMFGQNSNPATTREWPDVEEIRRLLEMQVERIARLLAEKSVVIAREANKTSRNTGWPLLPGMIHAWHDEARHQGEMYLLLKQWSARTS
jgi:hypothetical protein